MARRRTKVYAAQDIPQSDEEITEKLSPFYTRPWATIALATLMNPQMFAPRT